MKKFNFLENLLRKKFVMSGMSGMNGLIADAVNPDSQPTVNRQSRLTSVQRQDSVSGATMARQWLRYAAMLLMLISIGERNVWATDVTFTGSDSGGWSTSQESQSGTKSGVTLACTSGLRSGDEIRMYKSQTTTISAPSGYNVTKIVFTCTKDGTTKEGPGCFGAGAPSGYTYESDGPTGTWTGSAASVEFYTTDNQVRATSIVVTIQASVTYAVTWKSDGVIVHTDASVPSGTTVSTPSNPSVPTGCSGGTFMGWTATENYSANTAPPDIFNSTSPTITAAITFYAVFADEDED